MGIVTEALTYHMMEAEVGNMFTANTLPEPIAIRLYKVMQNRETSPEFRIPFTILFETPATVLLVEGHYELQSTSGKSYVMHISPIVSPPVKQYYQAVFN